MKRFLLKIALNFHLLMVRLGIVMKNVDDEILKADPNLTEKNKKEQKQMTRNPLLRKFEQGKRDERYVQDYYELLRKGDEFLKKSTPAEQERVARKWGLTIGMSDGEVQDRRDVARRKLYGDKNAKLNKDKWGKRYDHFGFFDSKSKNAGKTLGEVIENEVKQRKTKDDDYPIEIMYTNIPQTKGILEYDEYFNPETGQLYTELEKALKRKFPLKITRENDREPVNKIEQLTEYLHIKRVTEEYRILEFFIPAKYGVGKLKVDDPIFKEIVDVKYVWVHDKYDKKFGYNVEEYYKTTNVVNENLKPEDDGYVLYNVIKLNAKLIESYE